ncbi:DgyrCDS5807 [Dimorphilus gyrociliatus]|uniref:DgyrCDS5807 n=1 Tax=Dimorphilus gyrociliatus TaxID=2664684 RepID=A0A7I8VKZ9_9ANNE|nr:DgyrCDS5807 [Dimorphilus gyrociliatus]
MAPNSLSAANSCWPISVLGIKKRIRLEEGADEAEELGKLRVIHKPKSLITLPRDTTIVSMPKVTAVSPRPRNLRGRIIIDQTPLTWKQLVQKKFASRLKGGHLKLQGKKQTESRRQRVAIIIPYRNRDSHFRVLLRYLHPLLQRQNLVEYTIYIVEQKNKLPFNRALLINIGFAEAMKIHPFDCLIFHDVDLIPEDDRNLYNCAAQPKHMSVAVSSFDYKLPYTDIFGGVGAVFSNQFKAINGMSNCFFGWGGEDDDLRNRLTEKAYRIVRPSETIARYTMLTHDQQFRSHERFKLLYSGFESASSSRERFHPHIRDTLHRQRQEMQLLINELKKRDKELTTMSSSHRRQLLSWEEDKRKLKAATEHLQTIEKDNKQLKDENERIREEIKKFKGQVNRLNENKACNLARSLEMEKKNKDLAEAIDEMTSNMGRLEAKEIELSNMLSLRESDMESATKHIIELNQRLKEENSKRRLLEGVQSKWTKLCKEFEELQREKSIMQEALVSLQDSNSRKEDIINLLKSAQERSDCELNSLRDELEKRIEPTETKSDACRTSMDPSSFRTDINKLRRRSSPEFKLHSVTSKVESTSPCVNLKRTLKKSKEIVDSIEEMSSCDSFDQ